MKTMKLSNRTVTINGLAVRKIYGGFGDNQPCILAKQVAELHGQELKEINRIVNNNLGWFDEGIDIVNLAVIRNHHQEVTDFLLNFYTQDALNASKYIYLLSQQGYALLCKLLKSDLARQIYKQMVRDYFRMKENSGENQITSEQFIESVRHFKIALEAVRISGLTNEHKIRLAANQITKNITGMDFLEFVRPGYVQSVSEDLKKSRTAQAAGHDEALSVFVNTWWEKYGEEPVDSHYLRQMVIDNDIPLNIGTGTRRSQKTRISRILSKLKGKKIASWHITEAGIYRNSKLWKLKPSENK